MLKKQNFDFGNVLKYAFIFLISVFFNKIEKDVMPYSTAIFITAISFGGNLIITPVLYLSSFLILQNTGLLAFAGITCAFFIIIMLIYKKFQTTPKYELTAYSLIALTIFIAIGDTNALIPMERRVYTSVFTVALTFLSTVCAKAISEKGLKNKLGYEEFASFALIFIVSGIGVCNVLSPYVWKGISVFIILLSAFVYKRGFTVITSTVLGISSAIYYGNINYVSLFLLLGLTAESLMPLSRFISGTAVALIDYCTSIFFGVFGNYQTAEFIAVLTPVALFFIIPTKPLKALKEKLYAFREKSLARVSINRNRLLLSNKLYDLSTVFSEMADALYSFKENGITEEKAKAVMVKEVINCACKNCPANKECRKYEFERCEDIKKMTDMGFAKGKLSLIDMPKSLSETCMHPNNILFGLNRLLADYRTHVIENANLTNGRNLIASEINGVSDILKDLALESGTQLKYQNRIERTLSENLLKNGFAVSELLIYGEEERLSVGLIITMKEFSIDKLTEVINKTVGGKMQLADKNDVSEDKCYLLFLRAVPFDAVFGIAKETKKGSTVSGDTHSIIRISGDKFLVALSDGMGSGNNANNISNISLSLIESFYKAGMQSDLILGTVNKLMSINTEESFAALDISVIDLKSCSADFVKYGAPYGFIVGDNGIRIIEGSSLPLGILEELKPSVCTTKLEVGDMIILFTDGVTDAFTSPTDVVDFLRTVPAKNPQTLASELLRKALLLSNGEKKDDMTVLCVRVYKKSA